MLQLKDIKFVIYGVSFEQSDVTILITEYETVDFIILILILGPIVSRPFSFLYEVVILWNSDTAYTRVRLFSSSEEEIAGIWKWLMVNGSVFR
jgi:hypothetical protein